MTSKQYMLLNDEIYDDILRSSKDVQIKTVK